MRQKVNVKFAFHNVGQGLFYTGKIKGFNFIYDCGAKNKKGIKKAIETYKNTELYGNSIDLLIISHFHDDHVNGLEALFKNTNVDTVVIPYFDPIERLILALRRIRLDTWYYYFLADPVSYLFEKKVGRVIIIGGTEGEVSSSPGDILPPEEGEAINRVEKIDITKMPEDQGLEKTLRKNEDHWEKFIDKNKLLIKNHNGFIKILGIWIFRFFNYKLKEKKLKLFNNCLIRNRIDFENMESIRKSIKDVKTRRILKKCYNHLNKNLNHTSLVAYHGPVGKYKAAHYILKSFRDFCWICHLIEPRFWFFRSNNLGQFLMGDLDLNYKYQELMRHYHNYLNTISLSQIPHHGARRNWRKGMLYKTKNCHLWVSSSGFSSPYLHPHISVVSDILNEGRCFAWSNEFSKITIKGEVKW